MNDSEKIVKFSPEVAEFIKGHSTELTLEEHGVTINSLRMKLVDVDSSNGLFKILDLPDDKLSLMIIHRVSEMRKLQKEYFKTRDRGVLEKSKQQERFVDKLIDDLSKPKLF